MTRKKQNTLFVVLAYAFFWALLIVGICVMLSGNDELFEIILPYIQVIGTWAPTFALLVLFKKLYPGLTIKQFYKNAFKERLNFKLLLVVTIVYTLVPYSLVGFAAFSKGVSFFSLLNYSLDGFLITLFSGATGEESGWRGHLQNSLEKKHSVLMASLLIGIIWAFWHAPTWMAFGVTGMELLKFVLFDILSKISLAFVLGICYSRCKNLFVPIWIHFVANMAGNGIQGVLVEYHSWSVLLEVLTAIGYIVWYTKISKKSAAAD